MRVLSLSIILALAHLSALVYALPFTGASLSLRREISPNTKSNLLLSRLPTGPPLLPRDPPRTFIYRAPNSRTYIILTLRHAFEGTAIRDLLTLAMHTINLQLDLGGDGPLAGGSFDRESSTTGLVLRAWNDNNHQTTWGVLGAAVTAMLDGMGRDGWGWGTFRIYDGENQVGSGIIEPGGK